ncbi:MAG: hypothetical protein ABJE95_14890 [Byssovorax sp.]
MKASRAAALIAGVVALLSAPSCAGERGAVASASASIGAGGAGGSTGSAGSGALVRGATWSLTWDTERVSRPASGGWSVDTDRGYRVHVSSGWLVTYSVSLGLCDSGGQGGGGSAFGRFFGVRSAYAHEDGNASTIDVQHAEDLVGSLEPHRPWSAAFAAARYCRVHWLAGRADQRVDSPAGVDLQGQSLILAGTWERDGTPHELAVSTWWPQGYLVDLDSSRADAPDDGEARIAEITVKRSLGSLFDGIDLASVTEAELAGSVLENLALHADAKVTLWSLADR